MSKKTERHTVRMTRELHNLMAQVIEREGHTSVNSFINAAIRAYVDETGNIVGSRRHFSRRMQERMDRLEALLIWNALQGQVLNASGTFTILDNLFPEEEAHEPPSPDVQLNHANQVSRRHIGQFMAQQRDLIPVIEEQLKKERTKKTK